MQTLIAIDMVHGIARVMPQKMTGLPHIDPWMRHPRTQLVVVVAVFVVHGDGVHGVEFQTVGRRDNEWMLGLDQLGCHILSITKYQEGR